jgi:hypothetical protein
MLVKINLSRIDIPKELIEAAGQTAGLSLF